MQLHVFLKKILRAQCHTPRLCVWADGFVAKQAPTSHWESGNKNKQNFTNSRE